MAKIDVPRLIIRVRRRRNLYYWAPSATLRDAGWKMEALGTDLDAAVILAKKLNQKVEEWRNGGARPRAVKAFVKRGTVDQLIAAFEEREFPRLKPSTRKTYSWALRVLSRWSGPEEIAHITRARVRKLRDALLRPDGKTGTVSINRASGVMRVGATLFDFGAKEDFLPEGTLNPFAEQRMPTPPPRHQVWSADAVDRIKALAIRDDQPGLALAILLGREIGQREGDLLRLSLNQWIEIPRFKLDPVDWERMAEPGAGGVRAVRGFRIRQGKTDRWIEVPVVGETRRLVEQAVERAIAASSTVLLLERQESDGRESWTRWTETRFQRAIAALRDRAATQAAAEGLNELPGEIAGLQFRDLRRTAVVWLGELGIEDHLIAAITGHKLEHTRKILETYLPRTTKMAGKAIALRLERDGSRRETPGDVSRGTGEKA